MSTPIPTSGQPIDRDHLRRATLGDRALERELLAMFETQLTEARTRFAVADAAERSRIAHAIKGAARGLGAFEIADCAAKIERNPGQEGLVGEFRLLADRLCDEISSIRE